MTEPVPRTDSGDEKPVATVIRFPSARPTPPPSRQQSPEAWLVPRWLTAPVLAVAIPHSPLARGTERRLDPPASAPTETADEAPATVGFGEPEEAPQKDAAPEGASAAATAQTASVQPPPIEPLAAAPAPAEPSPAAIDEPAAAAAHSAESLAQALRRVVADRAAGDEPDGPAGDRPLPRSAGEARPGVRQLRAERPLGAPQAAIPRPATPGAAGEAITAPGLPVANPPSIMLEPQFDPTAAAEAAVPARLPDRQGDRPAIRNRRLYRRVTIDAGFEIDGAASDLLDISMGGFAAAKAPPLAPGMTVPVRLKLSIDGVDISTAMRASMVYCAEPRSGGRFIDLTASQTALLRYIVTWRGQTVGALGTTTLLDAITRWPTQTASSAPALPPAPPERRPSWWSRALSWLRPRPAPDR